MSNILEIMRQHFMYNAIGMKANLDDIMKRGRNKFVLPNNQKGRVAVITGGARGIGAEVVKSLLQCDMNVIIGCRSVSAGEKAVQAVRDAGVETGAATVLELDIGSLGSVRDFAKKVLSTFPRIHVLINNAGIMFVPYKLTVDGHESQFAVNYLGHFLLTHLLLPRLETSASEVIASRVVNVSSCAHFGGSLNFDDLEMKDNYISSAAYANSKLAQLMFTKAVQRRMESRGVPLQIHAVHPGVVNTELFDGTYIKKLFPWAPPLLFKSPVEGAVSVSFAAVSPQVEGKGGSYISNCGEESCSRTARNEELQERLFEETCKMLSIVEFGRP